METKMNNSKKYNTGHSNKIGNLDEAMFLRMLLANPFNLNVKRLKRCPKVGDKVEITNDLSFNKQELRELIKLNNIITVFEVNPIVINNELDEGYHWEFEICSAEFPNVNILGWHYKVL